MEDEVEIYRDKSLGMGSYGSVCKARIGELTCAAKSLHPILFHCGDPNSQDAIVRFEQECQFLRDLHHPHIIQYLGTFWDKDTGLPVLLMELMSESLTHFLKYSAMPVSYYMQLNMCHDIALALAFLHSRGVIHRDLSSNNILLSADRRAKVTDFGMSKLAGTNIQFATLLTQCPGCPQYMPPEALKQPPVYTNKLDCFSLGVLAIQIMTRRFPNPGESTQVIDDPQYPTGTILRVVTEVERRKTDIDLIDPTHPLLRIALECLKNSERDRPSARDLCRQLSQLKSSPQYQQDSQQKSEFQKITALQCELDRKNQQLLKKDAKIQEQQSVLQQLETRLTEQQKENAYLLQRLSESQEEVQHLKQTQQKRSIESSVHLRKPHSSESSQSTTKKLQWSIYDTTLPKPISRGTSATKNARAYFCGRGERKVYMFDSEENKWSTLQKCPSAGFGLAIVNGLPTAVGGVQDGKPINTLFTYIESRQGAEWRAGFYNAMPTKRCNTAVVTSTNLLIVAGGENRLWGGQKLSAVEVMITDSLQWNTVAQLPQPLSLMSAVICNEELCLMGGVDDNSIATKAVYCCSLPALIQTMRRVTWTLRPRATSTSSLSVWEKCAPLPVINATATTSSGHMLAIGGCDCSEHPSASVYAHSKSGSKSSWDVISTMPTSRSLCLTEVLSGEKLLVVGGYVDCGTTTLTNVVEVASFI